MILTHRGLLLLGTHADDLAGALPALLSLRSPATLALPCCTRVVEERLRSNERSSRIQLGFTSPSVCLTRTADVLDH